MRLTRALVVVASLALAAGWRRAADVAGADRGFAGAHDPVPRELRRRRVAGVLFDE